MLLGGVHVFEGVAVRKSEKFGTKASLQTLQQRVLRSLAFLHEEKLRQLPPVASNVNLCVGQVPGSLRRSQCRVWQTGLQGLEAARNSLPAEQSVRPVTIPIIPKRKQITFTVIVIEDEDEEEEEAEAEEKQEELEEEAKNNNNNHHDKNKQKKKTSTRTTTTTIMQKIVQKTLIRPRLT